jgi:ribosomal protein S27E
LWNIRRFIKSGKYDYAVVPEHPKAYNKYGYYIAHRVIMENFIGRLLEDNEIVHHKDKNGHNNSIENLEIMIRKDHCKFHNIKYPEGHFVELTCDGCGRKFNRKFNNRPEIKNGEHVYCSKDCMRNSNTSGRFIIQYPNGHFIKLICDNCGEEFIRKFNERPEVRGNKNVYCSKKCMYEDQSKGRNNRGQYT